MEAKGSDENEDEDQCDQHKEGEEGEEEEEEEEGEEEEESRKEAMEWSRHAVTVQVLTCPSPLHTHSLHIEFDHMKIELDTYMYCWHVVWCIVYVQKV